MHILFVVGLVIWPLGALAQTGPAAAAPPLAVATPVWAYPVSMPLPPISSVPDAQQPQQLPGTPVTYSKAQLRNLYAAPDWRPQDHGPMPPVVASGRNPGVFACGYCHLPTGTGRPENANLTGLTAAYMKQQLADFRSGARKSSVAAMLPQALMVRNAKSASEAEVEEAVRYFTALPVRSLVDVVESAQVPRSEPRGWMLVPVDGGGQEPIGERIVELPRDLSRTELRDPASGFVAHVPPGSIERGRRLVQDSTRGPACVTCHGADLKGLGDMPRLAGRSPSYLVRQLIDFANGARAGVQAAPMAELARTLSDADRLALAAYAASLAP